MKPSQPIDDPAGKGQADPGPEPGFLVNTVLAELARSIMDPNLSISAAAEKTLAGAKGITASAHGFVGLRDPASQDMVTIIPGGMAGDDCRIPQGQLLARFPLGPDGKYPGLWGVTLNTREPMFTNSAADHPGCRGLPAGHIPIRNFLSAPAMVGDELVGEIALANSSRDYTTADLEAIGRLADLLALAILRLRMESALKESESRYRVLYEESPISIWLVDLSEIKRRIDRWREGGMENLEAFLDNNPLEFNRLLSLLRVRSVNQATARMYRADHASGAYGDFRRFLTAESYQVMKRQILAMAAGESHFESEMPTIDREGNHFLVQYKLAIPEVHRSSWETVIVSVIDVTAAKNFQEALRKAATEWRTTFDAMSNPVMILNHRHEVTRVNMAAAKLFGCEPAQAIGQQCYDLVPPGTGPSSPCIHAQTMADGLIHTSERTVNGRVFFCNTSPIHDDHGEIIGTVHNMNDITEIKRIEEERMRSSKLESIGVLAGGIAHDFNNILMGIMGNLSMARMELEDKDDPRESIEAAEKAAGMARELTRQLLTFSRGGAPVKKSAPIRELIEEAVKFVAHGSNVRFDLELASDLGALDIDAGQISQVIHNLVLNAIQSMPEGGQVRVVAEKRRISDSEVPGVPAAEYVRVAVSDRGAGISPAVLPKIFDPYFTTKEKGTGLGLATSYSIVTRHGGTITVDSETGVGSCFVVYLPAAGEAAPATRTLAARLVTGSGRVLLMDDEEMVLTVATRMLRRLGYEVEPARDGAEAVRRYREASGSGRPFRAVIMDLTVPGGMGGKDAIRELKALDPGVRAIVASGYSNDPVMSDCQSYGFRGVVGKPYRLEELGQVLAEITADDSN